MRTSSKILMGLNGALLIALGIVCLCNYQSTLLGISYIIGIFALAAGIVTFISWVTVHSLLWNSGILLLSAIFEILISCLFLGKNSEVVAQILPYLFGIWALISGASLAIHSFDFKQVHYSSWWILLIMGLAAAVLGGVSLFVPAVGGKAIAILIGIAIILDGAANIVALFGITKFENTIKKLI